jgi:hypothetical protein
MDTVYYINMKQVLLLQNKHNLIGNNSTCEYSSATHKLSSTLRFSIAPNQILRKEFNIFYTGFDNCNEPDQPECTTEGPISELFTVARVSQTNNNSTSAVVRSAKLIITKSPIFPRKEHTGIMRTKHQGL